MLDVYYIVVKKSLELVLYWWRYTRFLWQWEIMRTGEKMMGVPLGCTKGGEQVIIPLDRKTAI